MKDITLNSIKGGLLSRVESPKEFFTSEREKFLETVSVVRSAFGTQMTEDDVFEHLVKPSDVYLVQGLDSKILGMCAYTRMQLNGSRLLFVDGIAIDPNLQGRGVFNEITAYAHNNEDFIGLKTQNPRMYRALQKFCSDTYPNENLHFPSEVSKMLNLLASQIGVVSDELSMIRGFYGKSLYPVKPVNRKTSRLFDEILKVNYDAGDSVLCLGIPSKER